MKLEDIKIGEIYVYKRRLPETKRSKVNRI